MRSQCRKIVGFKAFDQLIMAALVVNFCVLVSTSSAPSLEAQITQNSLNLVITLVFAAEMVIKVGRWVGGR